MTFVHTGFGKAALVSLIAYGAAFGLGLLAGFQVTLFAVPAFQIPWTLFCLIRIVQLRHAGGALDSDRESYQFALGGLTSSTVLLLAMVVLTQAV